MRRIVFALALFPALVSAQPALRLDVGLIETTDDNAATYVELAASATSAIAGPAIVSVGIARANAAFDVSFADPDCQDPGFCGFPSYVEN